jgi:hypothetical protein
MPLLAADLHDKQNEKSRALPLAIANGCCSSSHLFSSVYWFVHSAQWFANGFFCVPWMLSVASSDSISNPSSLMFRNSWPESNVPLLVAGSPYMTRGGDSSFQSSVAGEVCCVSLLERPKCMPGKESRWW